jgi:hypothetical protein
MARQSGRRRAGRGGGLPQQYVTERITYCYLPFQCMLWLETS